MARQLSLVESGKSVNNTDRQKALDAKADALNDFKRLAVVSRLKALEAEREDVWPLTEVNEPAIRSLPSL